MPITKNGNGEIIETSPDDLDQFLRTGVMTKDEFAFADKFDRTKQLKFDPSAQAADTDVTLKSGAATEDITLTLPATTGTLAKTSDIASFTTIQTPAGTSPVASGATDTLTLTSTGGTVIITGNSTTDTINLESAAAFTLGDVGSSPNAKAATLSAGVLNLEPASATQPGVVTTGTQTVAGDKTLTGAVDMQAAGAASVPGLKVTGLPYTAGSATTNKPQLLVEPSGSTSTSWNTSGTMLGVNAASGFAGQLAEFQVNGTSKAYITNGGTVSGNALQSGQVLPASNNTTLQVNLTRSYSTESTTAVAMANNSHTQSSGTNYAVSIIPTINSSSTAANTDLLINRTQTATGSGAQNLIDAQVGGTSKFKVDNTGLVTTAVAIPATSGGTAQTTYATGDTIYASASNTLSKLTVGASGQHIAVNSGIPAWEDFHNPTKYVTFYDDFLGGGTLGSPYFASIVNGTSASVGTTAGAGNGASVGRPGTVVFYAGSTSGSGYAQLYGDSRNAMLCVGGGTVTYETAVVLYALSNGTTRYRVDAGLIAEIAPSSSIANGIYFTYSDTINSGKWQFNCTASSSTTSVDTGITASTSWVKLGFVINAAGTSVQAYIDGSAVGSAITTNIPSAGLTFVWQVNKTVGTGVAQFTTDYVKFMSVLTSTR